MSKRRRSSLKNPLVGAYKPHKHGPFAELKGIRQHLVAVSQVSHPNHRPSHASPQPQDDFKLAMRDVQPMPRLNRFEHQRPLPAPLPLKRWEDDAQVLIDSLSDEYETEWLIEADEHLSYRRPGIGLDVVKQLRKGKWIIQKQIDLHGCRVDDARQAMSEFLRQAIKQEARCVRIIHGKGLGSVNRTPVLKEKVRRWLTQKEEVLAFVEALPRDGGSGVVLVLLKSRHYKA